MLNEVVLEKVRVMAQAMVSKRILAVGIDLNLIVEQTVESLIFQLESMVLKEKGATIEVRYPLNWFQAFKKEVLKSKRYKMKTEIIDSSILYPRLKVSLPNEYHKVYLFKRGEG